MRGACPLPRRAVNWGRFLGCGWGREHNILGAQTQSKLLKKARLKLKRPTRTARLKHYRAAA
jgi:hypothetical protein